jgi:hypothetical protein
MIVANNSSDFLGYLSSLQYLEDAFMSSGLDIVFKLCLTSTGQRYVEILYDGKLGNAVYIEGDSAAQAVKDVAEAVRL